MRSFGSMFVALAIILSASLCFAQDAPTPEDRQRAKTLFESGAQAFFDRDYARAIVEFKKAYSYVEDPLILYNISLAYLRLGNLDDALAAARSTARDADRLPDDDRVKFEGRWLGLGRAVVAQQLASRLAADQEVVSAEPPIAKQPGQITHRQRFGTLGVVGTAVTIVGGGTFVAAAVIDTLLGPDIDELRAAASAGDQARVDSLRPGLKRRQLAVKVMLGSGAAITLAGVIMLAVDLATVEEETIPVVWWHGGTPTFGFIRTF